jgi:hypothetical protein
LERLLGGAERARSPPPPPPLPPPPPPPLPAPLAAAAALGLVAPRAAPPFVERARGAPPPPPRLLERPRCGRSASASSPESSLRERSARG